MVEADFGTYDGTINVVGRKAFSNVPNPFQSGNQFARTNATYYGRIALVSERAVGTMGSTKLYLFRGPSAILDIVVNDVSVNEREEVWNAYIAGNITRPTPNVNEGYYSFRDVVDYHSSEVFDLMDLPTEYYWDSENTMRIEEGDFVWHMADGWVADFGSFSTADTDINNTSKGKGTLTLTRLQHTDEEGSLIYENQTSSEGAFEHTTNNPRIVDEVVREEILVTQNQGTIEWRIVYQNDDVTTEGYDEQRWTIEKLTTAGWVWEYRADTQADADAELDRRIAEAEATDAAIVAEEEREEAVEASHAAQKERAEEWDKIKERRLASKMEDYMGWIILGGFGIFVIWLFMRNTKSGSNRGGTGGSNTKSGSGGSE